MSGVHPVGTPWWRYHKKEGEQPMNTQSTRDLKLARANVNIVHQRNMTFGQHVADIVASFVGSWLCIWLHALWFTAWFLFRLDINLLTLIVSLEAIFLCCFIMISQNRQADKDRLAAEADYHTNLAAKTEIEIILGHLDAQDQEILQVETRILEKHEGLQGYMAKALEELQEHMVENIANRIAQSINIQKRIRS